MQAWNSGWLLSRINFIVCVIFFSSGGYFEPLINREEFFASKFPIMVKTDLSISWLSYVEVHRSRLNFVLSSVHHSILSSGRRKFVLPVQVLYDYWWMPDNRSIIFLADNNIYKLDSFASVELLETLFTTNGTNTVKLFNIGINRPFEMVIGLQRENNSNFFDPHLMDIRTGQLKLLFRNEAFHGIYFDQNNRPILAINESTDGWSTYYKLQLMNDILHTSRIKVLPVEAAINTFPVSFGSNGQGPLVFWISSEGRDKAALIGENLETGHLEVLHQATSADIYEAVVHPLDGRPLLAYENYFKPEIIYTDPAVELDRQFLQAQLQPDVFTVLTVSPDLKRWHLFVYSDTNVGIYFLYVKSENEERTLVKLVDTNGPLSSRQLARRIPIEIPTRDKKLQVCYLTTAKHDKNTTDLLMPTVVHVHGGPLARVDWYFDAEVQFLANRGYQVLQCNFRGSTGYGRNWIRAGFGEWGGAMQGDLTDALQWTIDQRLTDPKRVAIYGGSYGGYATLCGLAFTPEIYACGVDILGPSNLVTTVQTIPDYWQPFRGTLITQIGADVDSESSRNWLRARSPLFNASAINKPLMIVQSSYDDRVLQAESDRIVRAIGNSGVPLIYMLFPDEGHGISRVGNRLAFYAVVEQFLANCLNGKQQPIGSALNYTSAIIEKFPQIHNSTD
ncbi:Dipeptidyl peptidase family member 6 [Trichinella nelsoni]|uniref:Prolyl endopeptidase n=1 Tax=Trichinella nelsoni TaxID=6336 RepID=A0A0V0RU62_9BILA|nr:Dipeptidyl peptidase family member 6 [Trichinella nelsoni]